MPQIVFQDLANSGEITEMYLGGTDPAVHKVATSGDLADYITSAESTTSLTSADNISSILTTGAYRWSSASVPTNAPESANGYMLIDMDGTNYRQIVHTGVTEEDLNVYERTSISSVYTALWTKRLKASDIGVTVSSFSHNHTGVYEPDLSDPALDDYILSSTAAGVRSWVAPGTVAGTKDVPEDGNTTDPISANWAYDHENASDPHGTAYTHPANATTDIDTSGPTIIDNIATDATGHITAMGTRALTLTDLSAGNSASLDLGTTAGTVSEGDHTHAYEPADSTIVKEADYYTDQLVGEIDTAQALEAFVSPLAGQLMSTFGTTSRQDGGGGRWVWDTTMDKLYSDYGTIIDPDRDFTVNAQTDHEDEIEGEGFGCWVRDYTGPVYVEWWNAKGNGTTDDTVNIQAAINAAENSVAAIDLNPGTGQTSIRNVFGGGTVLGRNGAIYLIKDTLLIPPRVRLSLSTIRANTGFTWTDEVGETVDWITVTAEGTGYATVPTVTLTGGGYSIQAEAKAVISGGNLVRIYVTNPGEGYTSAPTVEISGGNSDATATAELATLGKPLVSNSTPDGVYTTYKLGIYDTVLDGNGVADCLRLNAAKLAHLDGVMGVNAKRNSFSFLGCDQLNAYNCISQLAGVYGVYGSFNWTASIGNTANEVSIYGISSKYSGRAEIRTDHYTNSWNIIAGTVRQNTDDYVAGHEMVIASGTGAGHSIKGLKFEHAGDNENPVIAITGGTGMDIDIAASPNTPDVHYKWIHNVDGTDIFVSMHASRNVMGSREENPNSAGDTSPFQSDVNNGIRMLRFPWSIDSTLDYISDWCRDMNGVDQTGTAFLGPNIGGGQQHTNSFSDISVEGVLQVTNLDVALSDGTTDGIGSAGAGKQYIEMVVDGTTYKVLHDGVV